MDENPYRAPEQYNVRPKSRRHAIVIGVLIVLVGTILVAAGILDKSMSGIAFVGFHWIFAGTFLLYFEVQDRARQRMNPK